MSGAGIEMVKMSGREIDHDAGRDDDDAVGAFGLGP